MLKNMLGSSIEWLTGTILRIFRGFIIGSYYLVCTGGKVYPAKVSNINKKIEFCFQLCFIVIKVCMVEWSYLNDYGCT